MLKLPKLSKPLTQLFLTLFLLNTSLVSAQTDLVRWNTLSAPAPQVGNMTATQISPAGGVTIENNGWSGFRINNFHNGVDANINYSKYLQFTVTPSNGYKISLSQFKFIYQNPSSSGSNRLQVRYSTDPSFSGNGTVLGSEQILNMSSQQNITLNFPANYEVQQTLYLRVYLYGHTNIHYTDFFIRNTTYNAGTQGPTITGQVSAAAIADLSVTKTVNNQTPTAGTNVTFTITGRNVGATSATGVKVNDLLPNGYQFVSSNTSKGSYNETTGLWTIGNMASSTSETLTITAKVLNSGTFNSTATISGNESDPNPSNNTATVNVTPYFPSADLRITNTVNNTTPELHQNITFNIDVQNLGIDNASGVTATHILPNGYQFISSNSSTGTYNNNTGVWTIGNLSNNGSANLQIVAKVLTTGTYNTTATVKANEQDPNQGNNTVNLTIVPHFPITDLSVTKQINNPTPNVLENVIFTITAQNLGNENTSGVNVNDKLPTGYTLISSNASKGNFNAASGLWTIGNLNVGENATLQITAQTNVSGQYRNTATISHDGTDQNLSNNTSSVKPSFSCANCTNVLPNGGGNFTVNSGQVYCLPAGTFTGTITLNAGGTICISEGANFSPGGGSNIDNGKIINNGTMSFPLYNNTNHNVEIINRGNFNISTFQNFSGKLTNYENFSISSNGTFLSGSEVTNYGNLNINNVSFQNSKIINHASFIANNSFYMLSGSLFDNKKTGTVSLNMTSGSTEIRGELNNSGFMQIKRANSGQGISAVVNNYGRMEIYDNVILGAATYLTNENILDFINIASVEFQGPMLQNNNLLRVTGGSLSLNSPISQMHNNGRVIVSNAVSHNIAGSRMVNNCTIQAGSYFVGNGTSQNNGLIWVSGEFKAEGNLSAVVTSATSIIRGADFRNSGQIRGFGKYYFTGNTNFQSNGSFIGDDPNNPIEFYDATPTGNNIFDTFVPSNPAINVVRPATMSDQPVESYMCSAQPTSAGYPPTTKPVDMLVCEPDVLTFPLSSYVAPNAENGGSPFQIDWSTIKLFEHGQIGDPTTELTIPGKGILRANLTNGQMTFEPDPLFTSGSFEAEYVVSNRRANDPIVYPSARTAIKIEIAELPEIIMNQVSNEICTSAEDPLVMSNNVAGGTWQSSNNSIATVANGIVTPVSSGTVTISYTVNFPKGSCSLTVQKEIIVKTCEACYKDPNTELADSFTNIGFSTLSEPTNNFPAYIPNGVLALESNDKGFVITRVLNQDAIADPKEGMLIYDIQAGCVKLHNGTGWKCIQKKCN